MLVKFRMQRKSDTLHGGNMVCAFITKQQVSSCCSVARQDIIVYDTMPDKSTYNLIAQSIAYDRLINPWVSPSLSANKLAIELKS